MKMEVSENQFYDMMQSTERCRRSFSDAALSKLYWWYETNYGPDYLFNPIDVDMEWYEYDKTGLENDYEYMLSFDEWKEMDEENLDYDDYISDLVRVLERETIVMQVRGGGILVQRS